MIEVLYTKEALTSRLMSGTQKPGTSMLKSAIMCTKKAWTALDSSMVGILTGWAMSETALERECTLKMKCSDSSKTQSSCEEDYLYDRHRTSEMRRV